MNRFKTLTLTALLGLGVVFVWNAKADAWNKKTILTVNEPIQIPGQTLEPGEYVMKLADSQSNRHIVQVFNKDESQIITTILAIPNYRIEPTGDTHFSFWETPAGQPKALRSWFYPGDNFGQEFAYPKQAAMQIAQVTKETVPTVEGEDLKTAQVGRVTPEGKEAETTTEAARAAEPAPAPAPAETAPAPAPAPAPESQVAQARPPAEPPPAAAPAPAAPAERLPETASFMPLIGLAGVAALAAAAAARKLRSKL